MEILYAIKIHKSRPKYFWVFLSSSYLPLIAGGFGVQVSGQDGWRLSRLALRNMILWPDSIRKRDQTIKQIVTGFKCYWNNSLSHDWNHKLGCCGNHDWVSNPLKAWQTSSLPIKTTPSLFPDQRLIYKHFPYISCCMRIQTFMDRTKTLHKCTEKIKFLF